MARLGMTNSNALIFVVDDDAAVRSSLKFSLEIDGFIVRTFGGVEELLRESDLSACRCFVVDQDMPRMRGLQLIAALRKRGVSVPAILITGNATAVLARQASAAGVPLVEKPFLGNGLIDSIRAATGTKLG
jgi:two-component system, LuxR family, response regulator FixJ